MGQGDADSGTVINKNRQELGSWPWLPGQLWVGSSSSISHLPVICRPCLPLSGPGSSLSEPAVPSRRKLGHHHASLLHPHSRKLGVCWEGGLGRGLFLSSRTAEVLVCVCMQFLALALSTSVCLHSAFLHLSTSGFLFVPFSLALFLCFFLSYLCFFCSLYYSCHFHAYSLSPDHELCEGKDCLLSPCAGT